MSFKLLDNNGSSDNRLHNRRRADHLLLDAIPSTEYIVNRSGKYCCKVCPNWPVFDTPAMLKRHRDTEKHRKNGEEWERATLEKLLNDSANEHKHGSCIGVDTKVLLDSIQSNGACSGPLGQERTIKPCTRMECTSKSPNFDEVNATSAKRKRWIPFFQTRYETTATQEKIKKPNLLNADAIPKQTEKRKEKDATTDNFYQLDYIKGKKQKSSDTLAKGKMINKYKEQTSSTVENVDMKMRYYAKMKQNGWVLDSEGKWAKDEECEFDSDEEPPTFSEFNRWDR